MGEYSALWGAGNAPAKKEIENGRAQLKKKEELLLESPNSVRSFVIRIRVLLWLELGPHRSAITALLSFKVLNQLRLVKHNSACNYA